MGSYENEVREGYFFCFAGIHIGSVLADGGIAACPNINPFFVQGNIYKDDFIEIWNNKFQLMRKRTWSKKGVCKNCKVYKWCRGNGLHLYENTKTPVAMCHYKMLET